MTRRENQRGLRPLAGATLAIGALMVTGTAGAVAHATQRDQQRATFASTEDNATASSGGNLVHAFRVGAGGALTSIGSFPTGGDGTGGGLGSQGAVTLADNGHALLAVNAASNTVTLFRVADDGALAWLDSASSAGTDPTSVTAHGDLVEVLNAGSNTVAGLERSD
ncbi:MAG: beta-propeller fold lactonase family protein, partial [Mycobacterium sp.]